MRKTFLSVVFFGFLFTQASAQHDSCRFDTIHYTQFYLLYLGSKGPFQDYKDMLANDVPARYWKDIYSDGKIVKRIFGSTWVGKNRTEDFLYFNGRLEKIIYSGGFNTSMSFYYDDQGKLVKSKSESAIFGEGIEEFAYHGDTVFVKETNREKVEEYKVIIDEQYKRIRYPYGNHLVYDEIYHIQRNPSDDYIFEQYYDKCGNLQYLIRRIVENGNIMDLTVFDIQYK